MQQFNEHPDNWYSIAQRVYKHDNKCACCGHGQSLSAGDPTHQVDGDTGGTLHIYHLDGDRSNVARWNLVQLCRQCADHTEILELHKPLMFAPTGDATWMLPHVAGWIETHRTEFASLPAGYNLAKWIKQYEDYWPAKWPVDWAPFPTTYRKPPRLRQCYYPTLSHLMSKEAYHAFIHGRGKTTRKAGTKQPPPRAA